MSQLVVCDGCGEPIDQAQPYYTASIQEVNIVDDVLTSVGLAQQHDYHKDHIPMNPKVTPYEPKTHTQTQIEETTEAEA